MRPATHSWIQGLSLCERRTTFPVHQGPGTHPGKSTKASRAKLFSKKLLTACRSPAGNSRNGQPVWLNPLKSKGTRFKQASKRQTHRSVLCVPRSSDTITSKPTLKGRMSIGHKPAFSLSCGSPCVALKAKGEKPDRATQIPQRGAKGWVSAKLSKVAPCGNPNFPALFEEIHTRPN